MIYRYLFSHSGYEMLVSTCVHDTRKIIQPITMARLQKNLNGSLFSQTLAVKYIIWSMKLLFKKHCFLQREDSKYILYKVFSTGIIVNIYDIQEVPYYSLNKYLSRVYYVPDIMCQSWAR